MLGVLAALDPLHLLAQLGGIFYLIVLPILLIAAGGFIVQKKLGQDVPTLTRFNFYFLTPAFVYYALVSSNTTAEQAWQVIFFSVVSLCAVAALTLLVARLRHIPRDQHGAMLLATIFNNSGNYGLPLQDLAFRRYSAGTSGVATALQTFVMLTQNAANFTLGVVLAASGRKDRHWRENMAHMLKFPPLYGTIAGLITVQLRRWMTADQQQAAADALLPFWKCMEYAYHALIPVALFTLGAQLAIVKRNGAKYPVKASVILRLLAGPALALAIIYAMGLSGIMAQVLLISMSTPTAVNSMLLALEFDNHADYVARAVFYSTLISPITITLVIFLAQNAPATGPLWRLAVR